MKYLFILLCLFSLLPAQTDDTLRVLFIGNSHTYFNNMPVLFDSLSKSAGRPVIIGMSAPGGYTLEQHSTTPATLYKIEQGNWHYVVLQEQSQIPTINRLRFSSMYPAARRLDSLITAYNETTAFFMTWGWKYGGQMIIGGDSSPYFTDYFHMQESVRVAYESIAVELSAKLCPVGMAWKRARAIDTLVDLWQSDNYHPTLKGSYLAACVFFSVFFRASPVGLSYTAGLLWEDAQFFQDIAWQTISAVGENLKPAVLISAQVIITPNPARHFATIECPDKAYISIYNKTGQIVKRFVLLRKTIWDFKDNCNRDVPDGVYFVCTDCDGIRKTNKIVIVK
jgi:hypothetical protein